MKSTILRFASLIYIPSPIMSTVEIAGRILRHAPSAGACSFYSLSYSLSSYFSWLVTTSKGIRHKNKTWRSPTTMCFSLLGLGWLQELHTSLDISFTTALMYSRFWSGCLSFSPMSPSWLSYIICKYNAQTYLLLTVLIYFCRMNLC